MKHTILAIFSVLMLAGCATKDGLPTYNYNDMYLTTDGVSYDNANGRTVYIDRSGAPVTLTIFYPSIEGGFVYLRRPGDHKPFDFDKSWLSASVTYTGEYSGEPIMVGGKLINPGKYYATVEVKAQENKSGKQRKTTLELSSYSVDTFCADVVIIQE
ncbi:MAG: hypothetical protein KBT08_10555 [Bacteroidales bacterium]|nr:hypothetical protein [Candidatus Cryptobacteroides onthequi]